MRHLLFAIALVFSTGACASDLGETGESGSEDATPTKQRPTDSGDKSKSREPSTKPKPGDSETKPKPSDAACEHTNDGECDEIDDVCAPNTDVNDCRLPNSCYWANDGVCDGPAYCVPGTDTADCSTSSKGPNSCSYANDGDCDEVDGTCAKNTDTYDCNLPNSCYFANDDVCDGSSSCVPGTDTADCSTSGANSCSYANDNECDEPTYCPTGTDTSDCNQSGGGGNGGADSCTYANDGECDEPTYCSAGTDTSDCNQTNNDAGQGDSCFNYNWECDTGLICRPKDLQESAQSCEQPGWTGDFCDDEEDCAYGTCEGETFTEAGTCS